MLTINYTAVLLAVVANFIVGFIWYTLLFGKAWAVEMGFDLNVKPSGAAMAKGMIIMVVGNLLMATVFAHNIAAWSFVPGMEQMSTAGVIADSAIFTWLGFYLPTDLGVIAWERKSWKLFFINTSYHLIILIVAATIFATMK